MKAYEEEITRMAEQRRQQQVILDADYFLEDKFHPGLTGCLVIDSNIWMNEKYDALFNVLEKESVRTNYNLNMSGLQFDEIVNIKKNSEYGDDKSKRARLAINRIESFQKAGLLNIPQISIDSKKGAYADPVIVQVLTSQSRNGVECTLISDDMELRIRVRQHLTDNAKAVWKIVEIEDLLQGCTAVVEARKYRNSKETETALPMIENLPLNAEESNKSKLKRRQR